VLTDAEPDYLARGGHPAHQRAAACRLMVLKSDTEKAHGVVALGGCHVNENIDMHHYWTERHVQRQKRPINIIGGPMRSPHIEPQENRSRPARFRSDVRTVSGGSAFQGVAPPLRWRRQEWPSGLGRPAPVAGATPRGAAIAPARGDAACGLISKERRRRTDRQAPSAVIRSQTPLSILCPLLE
jgi:hypothetical protein